MANPPVTSVDLVINAGGKAFHFPLPSLLGTQLAAAVQEQGARFDAQNAKVDALTTAVNELLSRLPPDMLFVLSDAPA